MTKLGYIFSGLYAVITVLCVATQGLFGESFVALILGMPWTFFLAYYEFWNVEGVMLVALLVAPMALNAYLLYRIGNYVSKKVA